MVQPVYVYFSVRFCFLVCTCIVLNHCKVPWWCAISENRCTGICLKRLCWWIWIGLFIWLCRWWFGKSKFTCETICDSKIIIKANIDLKMYFLNASKKNVHPVTSVFYLQYIQTSFVGNFQHFFLYLNI